MKAIMIRRGGQWAIVGLLTLQALNAACIRQAAPKTATQTASSTQKPPATAPDPSVRTVLQQQIQGAFDPIADDRRIQSLQAQLKLNPQDIAAHMELAGIYEDYGLFDQGLEHYTEVLKLAGSVPETGEPLSEKAVLGLGRCARATGRSRQALPQLEAFLKTQPAAASWDELGLLQDELGDIAAGERAFREAVARDGRSARLRNNLGHNLLLQNRWEAAESEFRAALELDPHSAVAGNNLGVALARKGDRQGALEQFLKISADAAAAHNNLAVVLLEAGQFDQSREELVMSLSLRPYFAPAMANFKLLQERLCERGGSGDCGPRPAAVDSNPTKKKGV